MVVAGGMENMSRAPFLLRVKSRLPWLAAAMVMELGLAWIMKAYGQTLESVALAYFIPIIMAMGGNVGLQSSTAIVRGLATGDVTLSKAFRIVMSEFRVGSTIGIMAGLITGMMAYLMNFRASGALVLSLIVTASMTVSMSLAATMGTMTPLIMHRLKFDPAIASGPFITAVNDVVNVTIYLTVATLLIVKTAT